MEYLFIKFGIEFDAREWRLSRAHGPFVRILPCTVVSGYPNPHLDLNEHLTCSRQCPPGTRRCCDVESTSLTLIQRRNNVVCPVGSREHAATSMHTIVKVPWE